MFYVHYNKFTGKISAWGDGDSEQSHFPDHLIAVFEEEFPFDPREQKLDPVTLELVPRTLDDLNDELLIDLRSKAQVELEESNVYMLVDADVTPQQLAAWKAYRATLRGLIKATPSTAIQMAQQWPTRPDNNDPILDLRNKINDKAASI